MEIIIKKKKTKIKSNLSLKQKARIRNRARVTPWYNPSEFDYVGRCLAHGKRIFEDNQNVMPLDELSFNEMIYGIKQCEIWRKRAENGRPPHSVDITCSIVELLLQDAQHHMALHHLQYQMEGSISPPNNLTSCMSLRLSYASTIIRGVNGIADSMQKNRATNGSSVAHLCSTIGIPSWVVDLRHDAAHNDLPSIVALRLAAKVLLEFLVDKYWNVLDGMRLKWSQEGIKLLMDYKRSSKELDRLQSLLIKSHENKKEEQNEKASRDQEEDLEEEEEEDDKPYYGAYSVLLMEQAKVDKKKDEQKAKVEGIRAKAEKEMKGSRTPRQCLNEFIKCIPMDFGMELLLSYLVAGGIGDAPVGRGVMIPGSATTFPETIEGARKIRERYSVILIYISSKWPGFVPAILIHMVDFVLQLNKNAPNDTVDAGKMRKTFFLVHWINYILSSEFFCMLGWYDVSYKGSKNIRQRPKEKWSSDLLLFLELPAPLEVLREANLPLHGLYNRCLLEGNHDLARIFSNILGEEIMDVSAKDIISNKRSLGQMISDVKTGSVAQKTHEYATLEELEAFLSEEQSSPDNDSVDREDKGSSVCAWKIVESWEPCAIGSIPGHP